MKIKSLLLAVAVLLAIPTFAQNTPKAAPKEQPRLAQPVMYVDVATAGASKDPDSTAEVFVNQIADGLSQAFDLKGGHVPKGETGFELRIYIINSGDKDFVTAILLIKPSEKSELYVFLGGEALSTTSSEAEKDGQDTFEDIRKGIENFLDQNSGDKGSQ